MDISPESYLVGCVAVDGRCFRPIKNKGVSFDRFQIDQAREFWRAAEIVSLTGMERDLTAITAQMKKQGTEPDMKYLTECMTIVPSCDLAESYADSFLKECRMRKVRELAEEMIEQCSSGSEAGEILNRIRTDIDRLQMEEDGNLMSTMDALVDLRNNIFDRINGNVGYAATGFKKLDDILGGGLLKSGFYIMAARPGMGKSTVALNISENIGKTGKVLYISLEMSARQLIAKRLSAQTGIQSKRLIMGINFSDTEYQKIADGMAVLRDSGVFVNKRAAASVADISTMARGIDGLSCIVIDHMGLVTPEDRKVPQYEKITGISNSLKQLAINLDVPILALCQLNRETDKRQNKRPELSDLRDSGAIEQDADGVIMLYSEEYYADEETKAKLDKQQNPSHIELIVRKNRHAGCGTVHTLAYLTVSKVVEE